MSHSPFTGTSALIRLALRRDRIKLTIWLAGLPLLLFSMAITYKDFFASDLEMVNIITIRAASPIMRLFDPPVSGASLGGYTMLETYTFIAVMVALMSCQAVVRHTRQNEETGRAEMIGSAIVGRYAGLAAALIVAASASLALIPLFALSLASAGFPLSGSWAAGAAYGGVGLAFAGVAALTAQLSVTSRGANGLAGAGIGLSFLLAAAGNMLGELQEGGMRVHSAWPAWLTPIGWGAQMRAFHDNHWWTLGLFAAAFLILAGLSFRLVALRDIGAGLLPARKGSPVAHPWLTNPFGLAWRLQRGNWLGWAIAMVVFGAVIGGISSEFESMISDNEKMMEIFDQLGGAAALTDTYFAMIMGITGSITAVFLVQGMLRMRSEEEEGTLEPVLGAAVSRMRWKLCYAACAATGTVALLLLLGMVTGITAALVLKDISMLGQMVVAALLQIPAAFVLGGVAALAFGGAPRIAGGLTWAGVGVSLLAGPMLAELLKLPDWMRNLSPFTHVSAYPAEPVATAPILWLLLLTAVLTAAGAICFRRRNLSL
ncbi:MAG: putative exporter of polyketide antibiotics-like protein [Paenibacillaceae bacterium]|jgi:ABC-2 type transport system permease protein|nr:putative exporter of polyketide antibiotics-like protein [Paenibacillaceae bacterium]